MTPKSGSSEKTLKFSTFTYILFFLLVFIATILLIEIPKLYQIQKTADKLGAKVDWQAVTTNKPPFYLVEHKAVRIQYDDAQLFKQRIAELGIEIDPWEVYEHEVIAGVSKQNIEKLQVNGYTVTILANTYEEYFNSPESKVDRGVRLHSD